MTTESGSSMAGGAAGPNGGWYFSEGGSQHGPTTFDQLVARAQSGQLGPQDLIWGPPLTSWIAAGQYGELAQRVGWGVAPPPPPPSAGGPGAGGEWLGKAAAGVQRLGTMGTSELPLPHVKLLDLLLDRVRGLVDARALRLIDSLARRFGHLAYVLAALLFLAFFAGYAIKTENSEHFFVSGLLALVLAVVGQYAASKFLRANETLIGGSPSRLASEAFLRCVSILAFLGSVAMLVFAVGALVESAPLVLTGSFLGVAALLVYVGVVTLEPDSLNIAVDERGRVGQEAVGIFMYVLKLYLRLVPLVYLVGSLVGVTAGVFLIYRLIKDDLYGFQMLFFGVSSPTEVIYRCLLVAWVPFFAYVWFVLGCLLLDVLQAILEIPGRLPEPEKRED